MDDAAERADTQGAGLPGGGSGDPAYDFQVKLILHPQADDQNPARR
jgi:hypothetical protein